MNNKIVIILIITAVAISLYFAQPQLVGRIISSSQNPISKQSQPVTITSENFPTYLQKQSIVKDLPKKAVLSLRLYNFDTGERRWVGDYTIEKGAVSKGLPNNTDVEIILSSKYAGQLINNFCQTIKTAKANGDFAYELKQSKTSLLWKYRGLMKYKDCLS